MNQFEIYLRKRSKILISDTGLHKHSKCDPQLLTAFFRNLQALGFGMSKDLLSELAKCNDVYLINTYQSVIPVLKQMTGDDKKYEPFYPNFPEQVANASDTELYLNALAHYMGFVISDVIGDPNFVIRPNYEKEVREKLDEFNKLKLIDLGDEKDFNSIFTALASSNSSISQYDKDVLTWFAKNIDVTNLLPDQISQKETLAHLVSVVEPIGILHRSIKTATDVLRVAVALSKGDVSLAQPCKFKLSKKNRRFILSCLNSIPNPLEDMYRWKTRWIRLGEVLHPGQYKDKYFHAYNHFKHLRNEGKYTGFYSRVENCFKNGNAQTTCTLLSERPGEFARKLDRVLRTFDNTLGCVDYFAACVDKVSTPVLLQTWKHFKTRHKQSVGRTVFPKGSIAKAQYVQKKREDISKDVSKRVQHVIENELLIRFYNKSDCVCYIDKRLKKCPVPFSQRSASKSLRTISRGSVLPIEGDKDTIRFFIWWKNGDSRVDLDLSASYFDKNWKHQQDIAFYNLKEDYAFHSGDITSAPQGACEFIDISLSKAEHRYIVMNVNSYTHQTFDTVPECSAGWMMREKPQSGEIFEARTVQDKFDLTTQAKVCVPLIIDTKKREVIWCDAVVKGSACQTAWANSDKMLLIGKAFTDLRKPTLYELFKLHAEANDWRIADKEDANMVFDLYEGDVTPFDIDTILSEYVK